MTKSKVFFCLLLVFIIGIGVASFVPFSVTMLAVLFILGGSAVAFGILHTAYQPQVVLGGFLLITITAGAFWFTYRDRTPESALARHIGERIALTGVVASDPVVRSSRQEFTARNAVDGAVIRVVTRPFPAYRYGDKLELNGKLEFEMGAGTGALFAMAFPSIVLAGHEPDSPVRHALFFVKSRFADAATRDLPEPHGAFLLGLLLGERQSFPPSLRDDLQASGTAHIVALSGYNITIVAEALLTLLGFLWVPFRLAWWFAVAGIALFTVLTGAAASVVRAAIMGGLVLIARSGGRLYHMRNALALTATLMLLIDPALLRFDVGFQLSFLATLGLLYGAPLLERSYRVFKSRLGLFFRDYGLIRENREATRREGRPGGLRLLLVSTLAAQLFVLPLIIYRFGRLSLVAPLANIAVLPFIPATMLAGFLTGFLGFFSVWPSRVISFVAQGLLSYELGAISFFAHLPAASLRIRGFTPAALVGGYLLIGFWLWRSRRHQA